MCLGERVSEDIFNFQGGVHQRAGRVQNQHLKLQPVGSAFVRPTKQAMQGPGRLSTQGSRASYCNAVIEIAMKRWSREGIGKFCFPLQHHSALHQKATCRTSVIESFDKSHLTAMFSATPANRFWRKGQKTVGGCVSRGDS